MSFTGAARFVGIGVSVLALLLGTGLILASVLSSGWTVGRFDLYHQIHQHGLIVDCTYTIQDNNGNPRTYTDPLCTWKILETNKVDDGHIHDGRKTAVQHTLQSYQKVVLILFLATAIFAFLALLFSFCAAILLPCAIAWNVCVLLAALDVAALIYYFTQSHTQAARIEFTVTDGQPVELVQGYAFYMCLGSIICYIIAFIVSAGTTVVIFLHNRHQGYQGSATYHKTWPKSNNTAV